MKIPPFEFIHHTKLEKRENVAAILKIYIKKLSAHLHNRLSYFFRHLQTTVI